MTYDECVATLPTGAAWSSSFGYPADHGYCEYWRTLSGERWLIANDRDPGSPFTWHVRGYQD